MELDDIEENKDYCTSPNKIHFHRIMIIPDTKGRSLYYNKFCLYIKSQVTIRYVVEVDLVSKLKNSLQKGGQSNKNAKEET